MRKGGGVVVLLFLLSYLFQANALGEETEGVLRDQWWEKPISRTTVDDYLHRLSFSFFSGRALDRGRFQMYKLEGDISLYQVVKGGVELPALTKGGEFVIGNPLLGLKGRIYSKLESNYPYFFYLKGGVRFPRKQTAVTFDRTDAMLELLVSKELNRVLFSSSFGYLMKIDGKSPRDYLDEISTHIGMKVLLNNKFSLESALRYRRSFGFISEEGTRLPALGVMVADAGIRFKPLLGAGLAISWSQPLRTGDFSTVARTFGDVWTPGLLGSTVFVELVSEL